MKMTEAGWLESNDPDSMLAFLRQNYQPSERKILLFGASCCRKNWALLSEAVSRLAVETAERFADGLADATEWRKASEIATAIAGDWGMGPGLVEFTGAARYAALACGWLGREPVQDVAALARRAEIEDAQEKEMADPSLVNWAVEIVSGETWRVNNIRDIFGNPFSHVTLDPRWLSSTVLDLARTIYEERAFDRLPILADALMDVGCDSEEILAHCRSAGVHVRGCWVVDLLLDKK